MKISVLCLALFLSRVLSDRPMDMLDAEHYQCIVNVTESSSKVFNESLEKGKKVIFFQIQYNSEKATALTKSQPNDHFADPNEYMWLYDGANGLPVYMTAPFNFELRSLFILGEYTETVKLNMTVSESCDLSTVYRMDFLRLVFRQLIKIVSTAQLPDKKASTYVCYDINNNQNISEFTNITNKQIGLSQQILFRYCCKVKDYHTNYNESIDLCRGKKISTENLVNIQTIAGAILFAFFPLAIGIISKAKLNYHVEPFSLVHSVSTGFNKKEEYLSSFGIESGWLNENDPYFSVQVFVKWLVLFETRSIFASRIRRSLAVISSLLIIFGDLLLEYFTLKRKLKSYLENNVPIGYKVIIFGIEGHGYLLGGPFTWVLAYVILGLIVINIPDRLCQTIAYSTLHQRETCTFLVQDIKLLQRYGSLNVSNLHDYDLLHAIFKSSLLTASNPSFWYAVIRRWFDRCRRVYNYFNNSQVIYQLMGVCIIFPYAFISLFLCVCELLLCIVYYGCPLLQIFKAIPQSYTQCYICPLYRHPSFRRKILGVMCFVISLPAYILFFLFGTYVFVTTFQLLSSYIIYVVIALIAEPHAISFVILFLMLVYFLVSIAESISGTYLSLQKKSIPLAQNVSDDLVYIRLGERYIYRKLFERIVQQHHPIRYEVAKALGKLAVGAYILVSCAYAFQNVPMNMSAYIKIGLLIFTTMIPKIMSVLKNSIFESRWEALPILETIYVFHQENQEQMFSGVQ